MAEPPPTRPGARRAAGSRDHTPERVLAFAGLVGLLVVMVAIISLIGGAAGDDGEETAVATATPTSTATPTPTPTPKPTPVPLTAAQRAERQEAADLVASRGFEVVRLRDYDPRHTLRVMIGESTTGARLAFFFVNGDYIGNDSTEPSSDLRVRRTRDLRATLRYGIYEPADESGKPTGEPIIVHFRWDGTSLTPEEALPAPEQRLR